MRLDSASAPIRVGAIEIDAQAHSATCYDAAGSAQPLPLTLTEFRLLSCLAAQPRRCFSRGYLDRAMPAQERCAGAREQLQEAGMAIDLWLPLEEGLADICADSDRMRQIISNLVGNALRHAAQGR